MTWLLGGGMALVAIVLMVGFTAWLRFLDDDAERNRNALKRRLDEISKGTER